MCRTLRTLRKDIRGTELHNFSSLADLENLNKQEVVYFRSVGSVPQHICIHAHTHIPTHTVPLGKGWRLIGSNHLWKFLFSHYLTIKLTEHSLSHMTGKTYPYLSRKVTNQTNNNKTTTGGLGGSVS